MDIVDGIVTLVGCVVGHTLHSDASRHLPTQNSFLTLPPAPLLALAALLRAQFPPAAQARVNVTVSEGTQTSRDRDSTARNR